MPKACSIGVLSFLACSALMAAAQGSGAPLAVPFNETFSQPRLDSAWKVDVSAGNTIAVEDGVLEIVADQNTYAHIERPMGVDFVRATCAIKGAPAITWCTSLFCYWDPGNYCQMGTTDREGGRFYVLEMIDQRPTEYDLGRGPIDQWEYVAIELAVDCVRYLSSSDGKQWKAGLIRPRAEQFNRTPELLIVGKGHGGPAGYPKADLNNDFRERGGRGTSLVRDLAVTPLEWVQLRATPAEREAWAARMRDQLGDQEMAGAGDPTFESVSRHYPAMKHPREVVGVKDHPYEIGVAPDGALQLSNQIGAPKAPVAFFEVGSPPQRFGSGKLPCRKHLLNGWMPIVVAEWQHDGLAYEQTVFGWTDGFSPDRPLVGYIRMKVTNTGDVARKVALRFRVEPVDLKAPPKEVQLDVPAGGYKSVELAVPYKVLELPIALVKAEEFGARLTQAVRYWIDLITAGSRYEIPEQRVQDAHRAWLAYNFLNVDKRNGVFHICDGGGFYEEVYGYSAALYCYALDLMGYHDFARAYLESLLTFQLPDGSITTNFGITDSGTIPYVISQHYRITRDPEWLRKVAPKMIAMCNWVIEHRKESMKHIHGERAVVHGLVRWRPYCDFELPAYEYACNSYLCLGMLSTAEVLAEIGMKDEAGRLKKEADAYLKDIFTSMDAAVITHDAMKMLPLMPETQAILKECNYTANGYYGLLAPILLETGIPSYDRRRENLLVDMLRNRRGLVLGVARFRGESIDHAYTYGYWLTCLKRDEPKRAILGLYGSMAYGMSRETYAGVEVTSIIDGENAHTLPHTYSSTMQLLLLRNMLIREEGNDLWIGQAVPRHWLKPGQRLAIKDASTIWGEASAVIEFQIDSDTMKVHVDPPKRGVPGSVKIRVRHPEAREIKAVMCTPQVEHAFKGEVIEFPGLKQSVDLVVQY